jgi:hypothetical protein
MLCAASTAFYLTQIFSNVQATLNSTMNLINEQHTQYTWILPQRLFTFQTINEVERINISQNFNRTSILPSAYFIQQRIILKGI